MAYVRMFMTALDPADADKIQEIVDDDVKPVFREFACRSVDLLVSSEPNAGGLVDGCILSRWDSLEELNAAVSSAPIVDAVQRLRGLLRQEPVTRIYEVID
ncbi:MAG: hypothetical protein ACRD29_18365 [Acidimicrobiales bacterium]